jgi:transposase-like protein
MAKQAKRKGPGRKGYSAEQKAKILEAAEREDLTGAQVRKRFGISTLTFYRWRGPVRGMRRARAKGGEKHNGRVSMSALRSAVRKEVQRLLPQLIREEVARALGR